MFVIVCSHWVREKLDSPSLGALLEMMQGQINPASGNLQQNLMASSFLIKREFYQIIGIDDFSRLTFIEILLKVNESFIEVEEV